MWDLHCTAKQCSNEIGFLVLAEYKYSVLQKCRTFVKNEYWSEYLIFGENTEYSVIFDNTYQY